MRASAGGPVVVYVSWPAGERTGGIKTAFRHVEALRAAGIESFVATPDGAAPGWFATTAPVRTLDAVEEDRGGGGPVIVLPENHAGFVARFERWRNRKVVFCQNPYFTFRGFAGRRDAGGATHVLAPGDVAAALCRRRFPGLPVHAVHNHVDRDVFRPAAKELRIAFAPAKRPTETAIVHDLFVAENPHLARVPWTEIRGMSEPEVAAALGGSAVALLLCRLEAFPLTMLEALAAGCVCAGFTGIGGTEIADASNGFWAAEDDPGDCAAKLARAVDAAAGDVAARDRVVAAGAATAARFDRARFERELLSAWDSVLASPPPPEPPGRTETSA
ncbi:MAG: Alpha-1,6-glucosyltransferase [Planctomycetes bacterium]|nr:Alpha-1,6-glucosyltransferase [Planctomycetota bacterium]